MKKLYIIFTIVFLSVACDDEKDLLEFYRSQPKDINLIGWWNIGSVIDSEFLHCKFNSLTKPEYYHNENGEIKERDGNHYWHTENNILHILEYYDSWMYGSIEFSYRYEIRGDTLFYNDTPQAIHTTSPL